MYASSRRLRNVVGSNNGEDVGRHAAHIKADFCHEFVELHEAGDFFTLAAESAGTKCLFVSFEFVHN